MNTNRNQSKGKKVPSANKLQGNRMNQKNQQEEFGSDFNFDSEEMNHFDENQKSPDNKPHHSQRSAWY